MQYDNTTRRRAEPHYESARQEEAEPSHCQPHAHRTHHTLLDWGYASFREPDFPGTSVNRVIPNSQLLARGTKESF
jgi:hypothetical protein